MLRCRKMESSVSILMYPLELGPVVQSRGSGPPHRVQGCRRYDRLGSNCFQVPGIMLIAAHHLLHGLGLAMRFRESWYFALFMDDA